MTCPVLLPDSYQEAVAQLAEYDGEARVLAGGQSLAVLMRLGMADPAALISLRRCPGARTVSIDGGTARFGARFTVAEAAAVLGPGYSAVADAARQVASPHVRNIGTVVGNVCHADPANDMAVPLLCHDAAVVVQSGAGKRTTPLTEFLESPYAPGIGEDELVVELLVPARESWAGAYRKLVWRSADHPVAGVAVTLQLRDGVVTDARVALGAAIGVPALLPGVRAALIGCPTGEAVCTATTVAADELAGMSILGEGETDLPVEYRRKVATVLVGDAINAALHEGGPR